MPVYEYLCEDCNDRFDRLVRLSAGSEDIECTNCSSGNVRRLVSSFAVAGFDEPVTQRASPGGGCCGGSCGCGH